MKHSTGKPTKAEAARMELLKHIGCVCCTQNKYPLMAITGIEVHHLLSGNRRRGHLFTIPLCAWHHRESVGPMWTKKYALAALGPSLAGGSKPFHEAFGSDECLLEITNTLLQEKGYK